VTPPFEVLDSPKAVVEAAAGRAAEILASAVQERGRCVVALTGGLAQRPLLERLAQPPFAESLPWDRVWLVFTDEHNVLASHPESNFRQVREALIEPLGLPPTQTIRVRTELPPFQAAEDYSQALHELLGDAGLDLAILGMGRDGHTASLFPGSPALYSEQRGAVATFVAALDDWRITLTLPELNRAQSVMFLVTGTEQAAALADVRTGVSGLPAARVQPGHARLVWYIDTAADKGTALTHGGASLASVEGRKRAAAETAAALVTSGMVVGLGTGSTARFAVEYLASQLSSGGLSDVVGVATSVATARLAREHGLPLVTLDSHPTVDITIDGADEVSPELDLIKGLGGALLREKMVANASRRLFIAVDDTKLVTRLGTRAPVPVAVLPFGYQTHLEWLRQLGADPAVRRNANGQPFVTDDGCLVLDLHFAGGIAAPASLEHVLDTRPGLVESGLFLGMADAVYVGTPHGVRLLRRAEGESPA
jgi:ribose 5-phosphate isomerase A